jgi:ectoine hydroxylase-related dioxygenase (phytanoyl-CoA dioxygenase family)
MSQAQDFFKKNGYYLGKNVFTSEEIEILESEFDRIVQQLRERDESDTWFKDGLIGTVNVQQYSAIWLNTLLSKKFLDIVEEFIGPDIVLNHSTLFEKVPSLEQTPFESHQDWSYLPTARNTMIGAMIHISEATEEMGCLKVFPGSQTHGRIEGSNARNEEFRKRFPLEDAVSIEAKPGDVTFFDYFIVHGSVSNRSEKSRKVVIARMFSGKDRKEDLHKFCENLVLRGWNHHTTSTTARKAVLPES